MLLNKIKLHSNRSLSIAGSIVTISDLMEPILPLTSYIIAASLISIFILFTVRKIKISWAEDIDSMIVFSFISLVLSSSLYYWQQGNEDYKVNGVLASNIGVLSNFQNDLGMIKKGVDGTNKLLIDTNIILKDTNKQVGESKKEISKDPAKELSNLGVPWSLERFQKAILEKDNRVIDLFIEAEYPAAFYLDTFHDPFFLKLVESYSGDDIKKIIYLIDKGYIDINKSILIFPNGVISASSSIPFELKLHYTQKNSIDSYNDHSKRYGTNVHMSKLSTNLLIISVWADNYYFAKFLLDNGVDPKKDEQVFYGIDKTPLLTALSESKRLGKHNFTKLFLKY
ncbi:MAG: hypothetical protein P1P78_09965 [Methyloprofundus sp.]|nr:hypothetical protein [Methyloprofundus sp.]